MTNSPRKQRRSSSPSFWPSLPAKTKPFTTAENFDIFLDRLIHDAGYSIRHIHALVASLAKDEHGLSPQAKAAATSLTNVAADLGRDFGLMRYLARDEHAIACDIVEDILQPALLLAERFGHLPHAKLTAGPTARTAPRVRVLMPAALQAIARLFVGLGAFRIRCTAEQHAEDVLFHLGFQGETQWMATRARQQVASHLYRAGIVAGEAPPGRDSLSLTLQFARAI
jgi:hypothetical protein